MVLSGPGGRQSILKASRRLTAERTLNKVERVVANALAGLASASGEDDPPFALLAKSRKPIPAEDLDRDDWKPANLD